MLPFKFDVLADMPQEKTICVEFESPTRVTQVYSVLLNQPRQPNVLVTVIVKNAKLTEKHIKGLAQDFLMGKLSPSDGIFNTP